MAPRAQGTPGRRTFSRTFDLSWLKNIDNDWLVVENSSDHPTIDPYLSIFCKRLETTNQIITVKSFLFECHYLQSSSVCQEPSHYIKCDRFAHGLPIGKPATWLVVNKIEDLRNGSQFIGIVWKEKLNHQRKGIVDRPAIGTCQCVGGTVRHCQIFVRCALLSGKQRPALDQ